MANKLTLRMVIYFFAIVTLAMAGGWLAPRVVGFYDSLRGGQLLEQARAVSNSMRNETYLCERLSEGSDESAHALVDHSVILLKQAIHLTPDSGQAYRLLGQAYCMLGESEDALAALYKYTQLRPKNPLGFLEFGFTYVSVCQENKGASVQTTNQEPYDAICAERKLKERIRRAWQAAWISAEDMYLRADRAFAAQQYEEAITWFQSAALLRGKPDAIRQFRWAVADVLAGQPLSAGLDTGAVPVYQLKDELEINGADLQWMRPEDPKWVIHNGEKLSVYPTTDPTIGPMWFQGSAVILVEAPCSSTYQITVRANHTSKKNLAGEVMIETDLSPEGQFSLTDVWQEFGIETHLTKGLHFLGVRYVHDIGDVYVQWMQIKQIANCGP